ncbi:MAG: type III-B CRISPR-associated protein Cas10/Cmr2 [Meiothermus sp.]|nr:MAG: type III-B CRISPR-associated protein Cas10/Cmr2 [Meiothermus sp.]
MGYLLQIAFGPVQDFIASARRTRDLYAGSRLLSEAAGKAAEHLADKVGYQNLIFPAPNDLNHFEQLRKSGIPNVVLIQVDQVESCAELAKEAIASARSYIQGRAREILQEHEAHTDMPTSLKQIEDLLEVYWACVPLEGGYAKARDRLAAAMAARKNTRDFGPVTWAANVPKSSLDGVRESVIHQSGSDWRMANGVRPGEELSGVDLLKRLWPERSFLSTSHLAALPYLEGLERRGQTESLHFYLERLASQVGEPARVDWAHPVVRDTLLAHYDPRLLFEGRLGEFFEQPGSAWEQAKTILGEMYRYLGRPEPYYVLLHADGDRMGEAIDHQSQRGWQAHRNLSNKLALNFAARVQGIVEQHKGCLVYAGGDDVLALLPLHTALRCAKALAQAFRDAMRGFGKVQDPTLSVGLAIVHHLEPLQDALELVRRVEKFAKEGPSKTPPDKKRNALAVAYSPRSGSERMVRGRWDEETPLGRRLYRYADLLRMDSIPTKAAYELKHLLRELGGVSGMEEALVLEARRILGRKEMQKAYREELGKLLGTPEDVARLADELIVAKVLARAYEQAAIPKESLEVLDAH